MTASVEPVAQPDREERDMNDPAPSPVWWRHLLNRWRFRKVWPAESHDPEENEIDYILRTPPGEARPEHLKGKPL